MSRRPAAWAAGNAVAVRSWPWLSFLWRTIRSPAFPQARDYTASPGQGNAARDRARGRDRSAAEGTGYPAGYIPADGRRRTALGAQPLRAEVPARARSSLTMLPLSLTVPLCTVRIEHPAAPLAQWPCFRV